METYPKRPRFFVNRFIRLLAKMCVAQDIGPQAFTVLTIIASTEDAKGYRDAVTFFNEQLMPMAGFNSVDSFTRARTKAIDSGWLHYEPGGKGKAGRYWVTIPDKFTTVDDAPSDESHDSIYYRTSAEENSFTTAPVRIENGICIRKNADTTGGQVRREPEDKCGENRRTSAEHSSLIHKPPSPSPSPKEKTPLPPELDSESFRSVWTEWEQHRKEIKKPLTPTATKQQLAKLAAMGLVRAIAALRHSMANGWQGIFEPDNAQRNGKHETGNRGMTPEEIEAFHRENRAAQEARDNAR